MSCSLSLSSFFFRSLFIFFSLFSPLFICLSLELLPIRFEEVVRSTAELVSKWQCVGFTHGVLNTDNMSILGLTIDYGPYGFMDFFDPKFVPNGSDSGGRYSYERQPMVKNIKYAPCMRACCDRTREISASWFSHALYYTSL